MASVLVVGGTGQTGPLIVRALLERGHEVVVLHGGEHERADSPDVQHLHADVHFVESLAPALAGREFDVVVATYGRSHVLAETLVGRTSRVVMVTGAAYAFSEPCDPRWGPLGLTTADEDSPFSNDPNVNPLSVSVRKGEQRLLAHHDDGDYEVTILRYSMVYGPDPLQGNDWSIVRRVIDGRRHFLLPDGGLAVVSRVYRDNAAHAVMLAVDHPQQASGQVYNVSDDLPMLTVGQIVDATARALGHAWELVDVPYALVEPLYRTIGGYHRVVDISKIKAELGYRDVVEPAEAIERAAHWWAAHPLERGGALEQRIADKFDYEAEDRLIGEYQRSVREWTERLGEPPPRFHPYRHPAQPGDQWSDSTAGRIVPRGVTARPYDVWTA
jgi:nucleoside-diphosphate-sugar epimerase